MKTVSVAELQHDVGSCLDMAQGDQLVVTRNGRPAAVMIGVEGQDAESVALETDPRFWALIRERRAQPTVRWEGLVDRLDNE